MNTLTRNDFAALYRASDDPWGIDARWYERRKRAVLLAALPFERVATIVEPGCGAGALSILLAARCDRLFASDIAEEGAALTRRRVAHLSHVTVGCAEVPRQWPAMPEGVRADCIVISELGYYLSPARLDGLTARIRDALAADGTLVCCHWKGDFAERTMPSGAIHAHLETALGLASIVRHEEQDFLLDVWSADARSVFAREGAA